MQQQAAARTTSTVFPFILLFVLDCLFPGRPLVPGVVYGRCSVSLEPADRGAPPGTTVLGSNSGRDGGGAAATDGGGNPVRREFFERHR